MCEECSICKLIKKASAMKFPSEERGEAVLKKGWNTV